MRSTDHEAPFLSRWSAVFGAGFPVSAAKSTLGKEGDPCRRESKSTKSTNEGGIGGFWIPQHRKKLIRTPHHRKKSWRNTDTAYIFRFTMINIYYINFSELQGFLLLWEHDIFTCEDKFDIFTCEDNNDIVCAITFTKFNCRTNLNSFLCERNIFDDCSETFGNLRQSSAIFGDLRKMIGNVRMSFGHCSENFEKSSKIFGKCSEMFGKLLTFPWCCCLYNKQNITCPRVDTSFIFECSTRR